MRRLFFNNFYVAGIRTGIQAGHSAEEMWMKATKRFLADPSAENRKVLEYLIEFADNHKTWVILTGGDHDALSDFFTFLLESDNPYPVSIFREPGLGNAITSLSIVLPERMYDDFSRMVARSAMKAETDKINPGNLPAQIPDDQFQEYWNRHYTKWELEFLKRKELCGLAS